MFVTFFITPRGRNEHEVIYIFVGGYNYVYKSFAGNEERPKHSVIFESGDFEIRKYEAYYVVATDYDEDRGESTGDAFRRLFGYISGDNKKI